MDWDEVRPAPPKSASVGENLETLSVARAGKPHRRLHCRDRASSRRTREKRAHEHAAAALFKKP